jgi:hypothetical protein
VHMYYYSMVSGIGVVTVTANGLVPSRKAKEQEVSLNSCADDLHSVLLPLHLEESPRRA